MFLLVSDGVNHSYFVVFFLYFTFPFLVGELMMSSRVLGGGTLAKIHSKEGDFPLTDIYVRLGKSFVFRRFLSIFHLSFSCR